MQTYELAELSGFVAVNGSRFLRDGRLSESGLREYWLVAKSRYQRWMRVLPRESTETTPPRIAELAPVLEEIFASELLTRVWTALVCQYDRLHATSCGAPVVWNVFRCHEVARHAALRLLSELPASEHPQGLALDQLRRRAEHWTDLLLAHADRGGESVAAAVAFDTARLREFSRDLRDLQQTPHGGQAWQLFQMSIRAAFRTGLSSRPSPHPALNSRLAASIVACFPSDLFEAIGPLRSLWQERLQHTTADALALVRDALTAGDR